MRPHAFDLGSADGQVDQVHAHPEPHQLTGAGRAEPELFPRELQFPDGGTTRSSSTGPPNQRGPAAALPSALASSSSSALTYVLGGRGGCGSQRRRQPGRQQLASFLRNWSEPLGRGHRPIGSNA
jgi:hypothetical protein